MIVVVEFSYEARAALTKMSHEEYERLRDQMPGLRLEEWKPEAATPPYWYNEECFIDLHEDGPILNQFGLKFWVKRFRGAYFTDSSLGEYRTRHTSREATTTNVIQVSIPDTALLCINEVKVVEDLCTDSLQAELNDGWRILAICPPNSQRRPDYILGRKGVNPYS